MADKVDAFLRGLIKHLMFFLPPQHGKSELVSRRLPAYALGRNPKLKIAGASYADALSSSFNRDVQRIIDSQLYHDIFPNVFLNRSNVRTSAQGNWLRNADIFEIVEHGGFYKSVGVGGSFTGTTVDIGLIDDPIKDSVEANSETYRERIWDWYLNVFKTRLHNDSRVLLTMTRWHEDDLAGRILDGEKIKLLDVAKSKGIIRLDAKKEEFTYEQLYDINPEINNKWEVVRIPAIKEDDLNKEDPRKIGEALWPEKHSLERLEDVKNVSNRTFISLYQQRPSPQEGDVIKRKWFKTFESHELPLDITKDFFSDTAYGKEKSDHSATICYSIHEDCLYIWNLWVVNLDFPRFIKGYKDFIVRNGYTSKSECVFEPKASGISTVQQLKIEKLPNGKKMNIIEGESPKDDKVTRATSVSAIIEAGRVFLLANENWIESFLLECAAFPNGKYDDQVDCLTSVLGRRISDNGSGIRITIIKKQESET